MASHTVPSPPAAVLALAALSAFVCLEMGPRLYGSCRTDIYKKTKQTNKKPCWEHSVTGLASTALAWTALYKEVITIFCH